jgi:competence protein ComEC
MSAAEVASTSVSSYDDNLGGAPGPEALVAFLDVGQGDATVAIDTTARRAIVIDCPSWAVQHVSHLLAAHHVQDVDSVIVTHYDDDHFSGVPQLVREYSPTVLYSNPETLLPADSSLPRYRAALAAFVDLDDRGLIDIEPAARDLTGRSGLVRWTLLSPRPADVMRAMHLRRPRRNIASAVIRLEVGPVTVIVGGDAPLRAWTRILRDRRSMLNADVLRTSHHGANMGVPIAELDTRGLFQAVGARHIAISVGADNRYAHPGLDTLHAARDVGARVLCTEVSPACMGIHDSRARRDVAARRNDGSIPDDPWCAGTISVEVARDRWRVTPSVATHAQRIDAWATPHCRENCRPVGRG